MFLIDKYKINSVDNIIFNKNIYLNLLNIPTLKKNYKINNINDSIYKKKHNIYNNIPNLLFYGLEGSGKKSLINLLIKQIFNLDKINLSKAIYKISGYGNNSVEAELYHSPYHIIIEPYNQCRQILPKTYLHNGYIDIVKASIVKHDKISGDRILPYIMNINDTIDIDYEEDWKNAESKY